MQSDWTVACAADDPEVVIPWAGKDRLLRFVDLRQSPEALQEIPEAEEFPCVAEALRRWNQPGTGLFTAKCDVWSYPAKLFDAEDLPEFAFARGSYIDLLSTDAATFASFETCERQLRAWTEISRSIELPACRAEWTLRPARIFPASGEPSPTQCSPQHGYATTLYTWGYGDSPEAAATYWDAALRALIEPVSTFSRS
ncbi:MAG TPA: hypothetical protein VMF56_12720 [Acidobacteriaceae bacterium]|nr:hypothetical protein [Acidobacteriaceae bacterium]